MSAERLFLMIALETGNVLSQSVNRRVSALVSITELSIALLHQYRQIVSGAFIAQHFSLGCQTVKWHEQCV